jgi:hypothetical protein
LSSTEWTATSGQFINEDHWPALPLLGVTEFDGDDGGPVPIAFAGATVKVYAVPFVRPVTVALVGAGFPETTVGL